MIFNKTTMGLCKCPKKKVTNLFCFEHTVNVCEHCLVSNHPKCVVQSYLQWLQDSDYDPSCRLCGKHLTDESSGPCVRLLCYDLFHWACLDNFARSLPSNTAPAGYGCPICHTNLFPAPNAVGPVIDNLKELLSKVNWARAGLGLPMIEEAALPRPPLSNGMLDNRQQTTSNMAAQSGPAPTMATNLHNAYAVDETLAYSRMGLGPDYLPTDTMLNLSNDADQDKYKRRPALQWLNRWFSSTLPSGKKRGAVGNTGRRRCVVLSVLLVLALVTLIIVMSRLGRAMNEDDPFLDPMANPNIKIRDS